LTTPQPGDIILVKQINLQLMKDYCVIHPREEEMT